METQVAITQLFVLKNPKGSEKRAGNLPFLFSDFNIICVFPKHSWPYGTYSTLHYVAAFFHSNLLNNVFILQSETEPPQEQMKNRRPPRSPVLLRILTVFPFHPIFDRTH